MTDFERGYQQGYADAMNWKTQNYLEHLPVREPVFSEHHGSEHYREMYIKVRDELAALQQRLCQGEKQ
jgi:hypothetical protein